MKSKFIVIGFLTALVLTAFASGETRIISPLSSNDLVKDTSVDSATLSSKNHVGSSASNKIDLLSEKAKNSRSMEDLLFLWKAMLELPEWIFIAEQTENPDDARPFLAEIGNKGWVLIFTDAQKAETYGKAAGERFISKNGGVWIITMEPLKAVEYVMSLHAKGIYGMRINAPKGWAQPIETLPEIRKAVNKN